ncbi:UDP-N-acetylglucosamine transferase subunit ALG14 [Psilocybe cubensis]|uniref:UDP-N-acetylglucosamine transferase subunit ALG14 n=1 Tax=Psilocybe cubensis TaxID=181762 RepID=A0ACB8HBY2_PSICU|nr:UDP-N-acetylglucosamine transferase subunit ALG14 [Psilocybe cubensis]KAH9485438.1 UDP-N-acetylglucosamine transferase subunit ALG14 [Psilocybe cubensis]
MIFLVIILVLFLYRAFSILPNKSRKPKRLSVGKNSCSIAVFLGSGGHTNEALLLISALDVDRYGPRTYIVSSGDDLSVQKAIKFESQISEGNKSNYYMLSIPRARRVHQSLLTVPASTAYSFIYCVYCLAFRPLFDPNTPGYPDVLLLNGPGTCFVLCLAVYVNKFLGLHAPLIIYIETFARVKSLSLSAKLIRPLADRSVGFVLKAI